MCSRLSVGSIDATLVDFFELAHAPTYPGHEGAEPGDEIPVIVHSSLRGGFSAEFMHWGLLPSWAAWEDRERFTEKTYNARIESAFERSSFRDAWISRHCVTPATSIFEKNRKGQFVEFPNSTSAPVFCLAGLWERRKLPRGWHHSFAILTQPAESEFKRIHSRMPVFLDERSWRDWLVEPVVGRPSVGAT